MDIEDFPYLVSYTRHGVTRYQRVRDLDQANAIARDNCRLGVQISVGVYKLTTIHAIDCPTNEDTGLPEERLVSVEMDTPKEEPEANAERLRARKRMVASYFESLCRCGQQKLPVAVLADLDNLRCLVLQGFYDAWLNIATDQNLGEWLVRYQSDADFLHA